MKTPKEKAKELFNKFYDVIEDFDLIHESYEISERKSHSIRCALIAVDEILNSNPKEFGNIINALKYWQEVKEEINNL